MDAILFWNEVALDAVAADIEFGDQGGPTKTARALAIIHLAMFDAFNRIAKKFTSYLSIPGTPPLGASEGAAIGQAAFITLTALYPKQQPLFGRKSQEFFANLGISISSTKSIEDGQKEGEMVAYALLDSRRNDGAEKPMIYNPSAEPGKHRPDPDNTPQGFLDSRWGEVKPFGISLFAAKPPPPLNSPQYAIEYNDVLGKGDKKGGTRNPEETTIGIYWAYDGALKIGTPPRLYNQIVRVIAMNKGNSLADNARLFALVNMAMADAGIQCWFSKYLYEVWRPVLGIREADATWGPTGKGDNNSGTKVDPFWLPLGAPKSNEPGKKNFTPPFPAYPSGHATFGAASLDMVRLFYGTDNIGFDFVSDELNGINTDNTGTIRPRHKRHFSTLSKAITENARSCVYLGVHWQFDADGGVDSGKKIAAELFNKFLKPVP
jgi:hypothetical protein